MDKKFFKGFKFEEIELSENSVFGNDNFVLIKSCSKCNNIFCINNLELKNNKYFCIKCLKLEHDEKKGINYSLKKHNRQPGNVSYVDKLGNKHIGEISSKDDTIKYGNKIFKTVISWTAYIDNT